MPCGVCGPGEWARRSGGLRNLASHVGPRQRICVTTRWVSRADTAFITVAGRRGLRSGLSIHLCLCLRSRGWDGRVCWSCVRVLVVLVAARGAIAALYALPFLVTVALLLRCCTPSSPRFARPYGGDADGHIAGVPWASRRRVRV